MHNLGEALTHNAITEQPPVEDGAHHSTRKPLEEIKNAAKNSRALPSYQLVHDRERRGTMVAIQMGRKR